MKKIITVLLVGALTLSATACAPYEAPDTPVSNGEASVTTIATEDTTATPAPATEETVLTNATEPPVTTVTTTVPIAETTLVFTDEPEIIHATTPTPSPVATTAPIVPIEIGNGIETTPYIPNETSLKWKYNCYTDKTFYDYKDKITITVENIGEETFNVRDICLEAGNVYNIKPRDIKKGEKLEYSTTIENLFGMRKIISGEYLINCHINAKSGSSDRSYKDEYLPITVEAGDWDNLIVSNKAENPYNSASPYPYVGEDITFTLTNESDKPLTVDDNFALEEQCYGLPYTDEYWSVLKEIPYGGKTELAPGESAEFVLPYDEDGLTEFFGRLAVGFTTDSGKYKAYSPINLLPCGFTGDAKPVIYLYPEEETDVSVQLDYRGKFTCTYPDYGDGWEVTAYPDGRIINHADGLEYSYLFWEGISNAQWDMSEGYVVKGEDTAKFLREALSKMGLTPKEYNEFIVYWLPKMQENEYNLITFQQEVYTETAKLNINPTPDSLLRIFMVYKPLSEEISIPEPTIEKFERNGFTVIEWGGQAVPADRTRP